MNGLLLAVFGAALAGTPTAVPPEATEPSDAASRRGADAPVALPTGAADALAAPSARAFADASVSDTTLAALAQAPDWRVRARAAAAIQWRRDPTFAEAVAGLGPATTRTGAVRFTDRRLRAAEAAPLLVERLLDTTASGAERAALVEALRLSGGDWEDAAVGLLDAEADPAVREQLVASLRYASPEVAASGLALAVDDPAAPVRVAAMRAIGAREDGARQSAVLLAAFDDPDAEVRAAAVRAAGWLGLSDAWAGLVGRLADPDAEVRLKAVAALERLDAPRAAGLPALYALTRDPDARVARAADRVLGR